MANSKDPLLKAPNPQRALFDKLAHEASGFSAEQVMGAAANLVINAIRQTYATRREAERRFDELFGRSKSILADHYDMLGRKRGVFPFDQVITPLHWNDRDKAH